MSLQSSSSPSHGLDSVNMSFLVPSHENGGRRLIHGGPLLITPRWDTSKDFLAAFLKQNRLWLQQHLTKQGAILIRGFDINSASDLQTSIQAFQPNLNNTYRGTSPRNLIDPNGGKESDYIFSAAEVPTNYPIAQHIEMSFLPEPPLQLFFGCLQPSSSKGGETALSDFRAVFRDLSKELKQKLLDKGIRYTRTHTKEGARFLTYDVSEMLSWPQLFGTSDKEQVEKICKAEGTPFQWTGPNQDVFVSTIQSHAFQLHPISGELVWFNHIQVFHWTTFPMELWFAFLRTKEWRLFFHFLWICFYCVVRYGILKHEMSFNATFGDGEPISVMEMAEIRRAIHQNMVFSRWQKGDLLMIDNFSTSHGRQPTYDKGRKIAVSWSDPLPKANLVQSIEPIAVTDKNSQNPQEKTPESTLTQSDKATLLQDSNKTTFEAELAAKSHDLETLFGRHTRSKSAF